MTETPGEPQEPLEPSQECWVIKLGGSLLCLPDLAERLRFVVRQVSVKPLIVVGGGTVADAVLQWDAAHQLNPSVAHWLAIRAMDFNRQLLETLLPETKPATCRDEAESIWQQGGMALLNATAWLRQEEQRSKSLPHSWEVTSDSIAAFAACQWSAAGLLLLKSIPAPPSLDQLRESDANFVDGYFHHLLVELPRLVWCDLTTNALTTLL